MFTVLLPSLLLVAVRSMADRYFLAKKARNCGSEPFNMLIGKRDKNEFGFISLAYRFV